MTVRDWLEARSTTAPQSLTQRMIDFLGDDANAPDSETPRVCVRAAARELEALVNEGRFGRESALDLLVVDALMTHAFEYASQNATADIEAVASSSARLLASLTAQRV